MPCCRQRIAAAAIERVVFRRYWAVMFTKLHWYKLAARLSREFRLETGEYASQPILR